ncbi:MAG: hypothetical protein KJ808_10415 [Acidobacteria bacterium]|nr:hypothetical protein [Acidobacteriota bacterium]MBU4408673.1 hypothetical protein [Pseudomonadota bacterium]MCG2810967.1 hypothetical protein [Candidatus Aminicenantes bacterium]
MNDNKLSCTKKWFCKLSIIFTACILSVCLYSSSQSPQSQDQSENSDQTPLYAKYYDQVLALEKAGKPAAALAAIPKVYEAEIPVDAFYQTLDKKKRSLLQVLIDSSESKSALDAYNQYYQALLLRTDTLKSVYISSGDLPPEKFFYLRVILDNAESRTKEEDFIESPDSWLVASALFFARKTGSSLTPDNVVKSWQRNIHLWDDVCVEQALLYLARHSVADLKKIAVENEDVREQINQLTVPQAGMGEVQLFTFSWGYRNPELSLAASHSPLSLTLQTMGAHNEILSEKKLEKSTAQTKILALQSGKYRFRHVEGSAGSHGEYAGTYGNSAIFEVKEKTFTRIFMEIIAGV